MLQPQISPDTKSLPGVVLSNPFLEYTTREQTLERCPNLALASAFFVPGTKGFFSPSWCPTVVSGAGIFSLSPGW